MYWVIKYKKDGFTHVRFTASGERAVLRYASMLETRGYEVDIDNCTESEFYFHRLNTN